VATAERVKIDKINFSFANPLLKFVFIIEFGRQGHEGAKISYLFEIIINYKLPGKQQNTCLRQSGLLLYFSF